MGALALWNEIPEEGDAYVHSSMLGDLYRNRGFVRRWSYKGKTRTLQLSGKRYVKRLDDFKDHGSDPNAFRELLLECRANGIERPSSYSDCFHSSFRSPHIKRAINAIFREGFAGAWEEAPLTGLCVGRYFHYDLTSAYRWASTSLPVMASVREATKLTHQPGLYRVRLVEPVEGVPYPFNCKTEVNATAEEIDLYGLPIAHFYNGVTWSEVHAPDHFTMHMDKFSFAKQIGRCYWGRWAGIARIQCETHNKVWNLPNPVENLVWASCVISRVKRKVFEVADRAHVFVDSVLTRQILPTGDKPGEWQLKGEYPQGVVIHGAGRFGSPGRLPDKYSGVPVSNRGVMYGQESRNTKGSVNAA